MGEQGGRHCGQDRTGFHNSCDVIKLFMNILLLTRKARNGNRLRIYRVEKYNDAKKHPYWPVGSVLCLKHNYAASLISESARAKTMMPSYIPIGRPGLA